MEQLVSIIRFEVWLILGSLALVVAYKMLSERINMRGLLEDQMTGGLSPGRVQLLLFTLIGAGSYLGLTATMPVKDPIGLPDVPDTLLLTVAGSNFVYLGGKTYSRLSAAGVATRFIEIFGKGK